MLKTLVTTTLIITSFVEVMTQNVEYLFGDTNFSFCRELRQVDSSHIFFLLNESDTEPWDYMDSVTYNSKSIAVLYNTDTKTVERITGFEDAKKGNMYAFPILSNDYIGALGLQNDSLTIERKITFYFSDLNLSNPKKIELDFEWLQSQYPSEIIQAYIAKVTSSNKILVAGYIESIPNGYTGFIAMFDFSGNMISNEIVPSFMPTNLYELSPDSFALVTYFGMKNIVILDQHLTVDTVINTLGVYDSITNTNMRINNTFGGINVGTDLYFTGRIRLVSLNYEIREYIGVVDANTGLCDTIATIPINGYGEDVMRGFLRTIDTVDNYVYVSNTLQGQHTCSIYGNYNNPSPCSNYFSIHKLDINGTVKWSKHIGGDAMYQSVLLEATFDGGCIVVVDRFDALIEPNENQYYIKLDSNGNVQPNFISGFSDQITDIQNQENKNEIEVEAYPNPATNQISFSGTLQFPAVLTIYDILGREVKNTILYSNSDKVNISQLNSGTYVFRLSHNNQLVHGKFLVE